jgi:hypothetical protein
MQPDGSIWNDLKMGQGIETHLRDVYTQLPHEEVGREEIAPTEKPIKSIRFHATNIRLQSTAS